LYNTEISQPPAQPPPSVPLRTDSVHFNNQPVLAVSPVKYQRRNSDAKAPPLNPKGSYG
jgi:hypothetical protein